VEFDGRKSWSESRVEPDFCWSFKPWIFWGLRSCPEKSIDNYGDVNKQHKLISKKNGRNQCREMLTIDVQI
jgi:hypothetical protein